MQLLTCNKVSKSYGAHTLFNEIAIGLAKGDRVGLIGPNGTGKSSLLKILAGIESPNCGEVVLRKELALAYIPQQFQYDETLSLEELLSQTLQDSGLKDYEIETRIAVSLSRVGFEEHGQIISTLSGGWKKRLSMANALVQEPDLILLDEPTNHLDLAGIQWLENFLLSTSLTYLLISHDRYFLNAVTTRIIELNPCYAEGTLSVDGNYHQFLERKDAYLQTQSDYEQSLKKTLKKELEWLSRQPKARTTKAQYRVKEAGKLQAELSQVKERTQNRVAQISFEDSGRQSKKLIELVSVTVAYENKCLFSELNLRLAKGMKLGIVGNNGSGKTSFLRLLTQEQNPTKGRLAFAEDLKIVFFDQAREQLDPEETLRHALAPCGDTLYFQGNKVHVNSWAQRFLFRPEQLDLAVGFLSGGEQARLLIARLILKPCDVLILDEPTNDLDIPTLDILEESLLDFDGALVLVTHDRFLLDRVCEQVLGFDGKGDHNFVASQEQWQQYLKDKEAPVKKQVATSKKVTKRAALTYMEKKELENMEKTILEAEASIEECQSELDKIDTLNADALTKGCHQLQKAQDRLDFLFSRWEELEGKLTQS